LIKVEFRLFAILIVGILTLGSTAIVLIENPNSTIIEYPEFNEPGIPEIQISKGTRAQTDWPTHLGTISHLGFASSLVPYDNSISWSNTTGSGDGYGSPVISDGKVFVGSADGHVYCFDLSSGERLWRTFLSSSDFGICGSPAVANNHVLVFSSGDDNLYRLRVSDGTLDWTFDPPGTGEYGGSSPVVNNGRVYVGSGNRNLYCVNENTGNLIWTFTSDPGPVRNYGIQSSPAVANGRVFVGACDTYLYCINESQPTSTASYYWRTSLSDAIFGSPSVANGRVYCGSGYYSYVEGTDSHKMFCLDELTGSVIWSYQTGSDILSSPAIAYGNCYFTSTDGELYCVDATDSGPSPKLHWSETVGDTWSSPAVSDGRVVVGSRGTNTFYCFNASKGTLKWSYDAGNDIYSSPAIADGKVVISVRGFPETILCFGGGTSPPPPPSPPENLHAQLSGSGFDVILTWDRSADDGTGENDVVTYEIYRSTSVDGSYVNVGSVPADGSPSYTWTDSGSGDGNFNDYFYIVRAKDTVNEEEQNSNKVGKVVYNLNIGWNLISIPLEQLDSTRETVLQTIEGNYMAVQGYFPGASSPWVHWQSEKPNELNDIFEINHEKGYYIKMLTWDGLVIAGRVRSSTQISLINGWNLVGFPSLDPQSRDAALSSIMGSFNKVEYYDSTTGNYGVVGPSDTMAPGSGYWIHATSDCDLFL
jgi:outer membrane protein assembly factor BamB